MQHLYGYLGRFAVAGYVDQEGPLFDLIAQRFQPEFLFVLYEEGGVLRGWSLDPTSPPVKVLVFRKHLLSLVTEVTEDKRYTNFRVRYRYRTVPKSQWVGSKTLGPNENHYLHAAKARWGDNRFGTAISGRKHAAAVDLSDVKEEFTAIVVLYQLAKIFHRGQRATYLLEAADGGDLHLGQMVALVDPDRDYDEQKAIVIGKEWVSPELVNLTFRTIHPIEGAQVPQGIWE